MNRTCISLNVLGPSDVALMRGMLAMFGEAFGEVETYAAAPPSDECLRRLLGRDHFIALAAVEEGAVVGGIAAYVLEKLERERSEIYIYDLAVAERHRPTGIATGLINELKTLAAARGAYVIFVQADPVDRPAVALYSRIGEREDVLHFDIKVG